MYVETHSPQCNENSLVTFKIGTGMLVSGDFSIINWGSNSYFVQTDMDPDGGTNCTITGTHQILSIPYALHAKTAESLSGGINETDPVFSDSEAANITVSDITHLGNLSGINTEDQDISDIAMNTQAIKDTAANIRTDIPDVPAGNQANVN